MDLGSLLGTAESEAQKAAALAEQEAQQAAALAQQAIANQTKTTTPTKTTTTTPTTTTTTKTTALNIPGAAFIETYGAELGVLASIGLILAVLLRKESPFLKKIIKI